MAAHEFRYMYFSTQTLVASIALFGFAALFTGNGVDFQISVGGGNVFINAPMMITLFPFNCIFISSNDFVLCRVLSDLFTPFVLFQ